MPLGIDGDYNPTGSRIRNIANCHTCSKPQHFNSPFVVRKFICNNCVMGFKNGYKRVHIEGNVWANVDL